MIRNRLSRLISYATVCSFFLLLSSCASDGTGGAIQATGKPSEVLLVMDKGYLSDSIAEEVKAVLRTPFVSLPQTEPTCKVQTVAKSDFDSFLKYVRTILLVDISKDRFTHTALKYSYNEWADGQIVLQLNTPSPDSLRLFLSEKGEHLLAMINRHEVYRYAEEATNTYSSLVDKMTYDAFGYHIYAPETIQKFKKGNNFLWFSNDAMRKRMDMLVYRVPYHGEKIDATYIIAKRDSILQANIEGGVEGSFPATAPYAQTYSQIHAEGRPIVHELRGLWEMRGGTLMGGPFVTHAFVESNGSSVLFVEGFVYHPNEAKKDLLQRIESTLYTVTTSDKAEASKQDMEWIKKVKRTAFWYSEQ